MVWVVHPHHARDHHIAITMTGQLGAIADYHPFGGAHVMGNVVGHDRDMVTDNGFRTAAGGALEMVHIRECDTLCRQ